VSFSEVFVQKNLRAPTHKHFQALLYDLLMELRPNKSHMLSRTADLSRSAEIIPYMDSSYGTNFRSPTYPALAMLKSPASSKKPFICTPGLMVTPPKRNKGKITSQVDNRITNHHLIGLPVVCYIYYCASNPTYWAAVVYIPKECRLSVWQDTSTNDLPVDQLFRMVSLNNIDWKETMLQNLQLEKPDYDAIKAMWDAVVTANHGKVPKGIRKSLEVGLSLTLLPAPPKITIESNPKPG
jgi:hypothetical protein